MSHRIDRQGGTEAVGVRTLRDGKRLGRECIEFMMQDVGIRARVARHDERLAAGPPMDA